MNYNDLRDLKEKVSIVSYASSIGLSPVKRGKYYHLKEYDSVRIDPRKNCFYRNSCFVRGEKNGHAAGSVIDFAMHFQSLSKAKAIGCLMRFAEKEGLNSPSYVYTPPIIEVTPFVLPLENITEGRICFSTVYQYLVNVRKIEPVVVKYMIYHHYLYEEAASACKYGKKDRFYHCCVFVSYNNQRKPVFAQRRACAFKPEKNYIDKNGKEKKPFKAMTVAGSDENECFFINNNKNALIVTEGICDTMAVMSKLVMAKKYFKNYNYLATTGCTKFVPIIRHLRENPNITKLIIGFDNDEAGQKSYLKLLEYLKIYNWDGEIVNFIPKYAKDHNDDLCRIKGLIVNKKNETVKCT